MADSAAPEYQYAASGDEQTVDVEGIIADFRRYFRLFAAVFVALFVCVMAFMMLKTPAYMSTTSIMIGDQGDSVTLPGQSNAPQQPIDSTVIDSEVEIMKSNAVGERVISNLHLDKDPEFNPALTGNHSQVDQLKGEVLGAFHKQAPVSPTAQPNGPMSDQLQHLLILKNVMGGVDVKRVGLTKVVGISYRSLSAEKAAMLADAWAQAYMQEKLATMGSANSDATDFLKQRISSLQQQVEDADRAVQEYKIQNNLLSAGSTTLTEQDLSDLNQKLAAVKVDQAESNARLHTAQDQLQKGSNGDDVGEALNSPVVSSLRQQQAQISAQLAQLQAHYGPMHPDVIKAQNQLKDINEQIQAEIKRIISNLDAQNKIQQQRADSILGSVRGAQGQLVSNSKAMVKLNELTLNAESIRSLYESYLDRYKQTASQSGGQTTNSTIVTHAKIPTSPSSPKLSLALMFAFAGATLGSGTSVFIRRAFDTGLTTSHDVERKLGVPYLTGVPALFSTLDQKIPANTKPHQYVVDKPLSVFAEGFRSLRAALLYTSSGKEVKIVALTSALPGEGKTTTSVCLALTMAVAGNSVCVVDCDLRRRSLNELFNINADQGLIEVLDGKATLDDVLFTDARTGLKVLPLSNAPTTSRDIFGSEAMDRLLEELRGRFDLVVLDTAPVLPVVDTRILARKADVVGVLVRWRHTPLKAAQRTIDLLNDVQVNIGGAALTQIDVKEQAKYGYGDVGYYYKSYKSYYATN